MLISLSLSLFSLSLSLPTFSSLSCLFTQTSLCWTIGRSGTSLSPMAVGDSFQRFWSLIFILQEIQPLLLSLSPSVCVCSFLLSV